MNLNIKSGQIGFYEFLISQLKNVNLNKQAKKMGFTNFTKNNEIKINIFNEEYILNQNGVHPQGKVHNYTQMLLNVILHYFLSKGVGFPKYEFIPSSRLTGLIEGQNSLDDNLSARPLLFAFGNNFDLINNACQQLGGVFQKKIPSGACAWLFEDLPKLPIQVSFFEADDEFPAQYQILFDQNSTNFVEFECLSFYGASLCEALVNISENFFNKLKA